MSARSCLVPELSLVAHGLWYVLVGKVLSRWVKYSFRESNRRYHKQPPAGFCIKIGRISTHTYKNLPQFIRGKKLICIPVVMLSRDFVVSPLNEEGSVYLYEPLNETN